MNPFTNAALALVFSIVATPLVSWAKDCAWPTYAKQLVLLLVALVFALLQTAIDMAATGRFDWGLFLAAAPSIFTLATLIYSSYFKNTSANRDLERTGPFGDGGA